MILALLALACAPDDVTDDGADDTGADTADTGADTGDDSGDTGSGGADSIVGEWLSEGEDISELFAGAPFSYVSIVATFGGDGSYTVVATNDEGQVGTLTGTYTVDTSTEPGAITLEQATPYAATAVGIWDVEGDTLTYEVVQTVPDYGYVPPTPETGFGTTSGPNIDPGVNVQVYVRQ